MWDPIARKVLKSRDVKFLDEFQNDKSEIAGDFINIDIMLGFCNREKNQEGREDHEEEEDDEFHSANDENANEQNQDEDVSNRNDDRNMRSQ